jgi:hypothetical protein
MKLAETEAVDDQFREFFVAHAVPVKRRTPDTNTALLIANSHHHDWELFSPEEAPAEYQPRRLPATGPSDSHRCHEKMQQLYGTSKMADGMIRQSVEGDLRMAHGGLTKDPSTGTVEVGRHWKTRQYFSTGKDWSSEDLNDSSSSSGEDSSSEDSDDSSCCSTSSGGGTAPSDSSRCPASKHMRR